MLLHRVISSFPVEGAEIGLFKQRMLNWSKQFSILLFLDSNNYPATYSRFEFIAAVGDYNDVVANNLEALQEQHNSDWLFGHICYDYKNKLEPVLSSRHSERLGFPLLQFFRPQVVCYVLQGRNELVIESLTEDPQKVYDNIQATNGDINVALPSLQFQHRISQGQYLDAIQRLRKHIANGDCYEINFCGEGYCEDTEVDPLAVFHALNTVSPAPFAAYYHLDDKYMMCASPERYIQKAGDKIIAQPIKGTARRDADVAKDQLIKQALAGSIKDRAENVMIADLMRNDLARTCMPGSVHAEELYGIYTFPQVHQMISTISGQLRAGVSFTDVLHYSFPMGSMTGAPKVKVMQLIEQYEQSRRELFSGTVGYITPQGDFDFNVIIRSLFYNSTDKYLSYQTGGAITYDSDAMQEWEEMRLKAWALEKIFS